MSGKWGRGCLLLAPLVEGPLLGVLPGNHSYPTPHPAFLSLGASPDRREPRPVAPALLLPTPAYTLAKELLPGQTLPTRWPPCMQGGRVASGHGDYLPLLPGVSLSPPAPLPEPRPQASSCGCGCRLGAGSSCPLLLGTLRTRPPGLEVLRSPAGALLPALVARFGS